MFQVLFLDSIPYWVLFFHWRGTLINNQEDSEILPARHWYSGFFAPCYFIWYWENFKWRAVFFQRAVLKMGDLRCASPRRAHARASTVDKSERRPDWSQLPSSGRLISIWDNCWVIEQIGHARPSFESLLLMHPRSGDSRIDRRLWLEGKQWGLFMSSVLISRHMGFTALAYRTLRTEQTMFLRLYLPQC